MSRRYDCLKDVSLNANGRRTKTNERMSPDVYSQIDNERMFDHQQYRLLTLDMFDLFQADYFGYRQYLERKVLFARPVSDKNDSSKCTRTWRNARKHSPLVIQFQCHHLALRGFQFLNYTAQIHRTRCCRVGVTNRHNLVGIQLPYLLL